MLLVCSFVDIISSIRFETQTNPCFLKFSLNLCFTMILFLKYVVYFELRYDRSSIA